MHNQATKGPLGARGEARPGVMTSGHLLVVYAAGCGQGSQALRCPQQLLLLQQLQLLAQHLRVCRYELHQQGEQGHVAKAGHVLQGRLLADLAHKLALQHEAAWHSMAWHGMAQHKTGQHSTEQHNTSDKRVNLHMTACAMVQCQQS